MKTRLIATLLAACTLASIAAGCGGSEAPAESSSAAPESGEAEAPASSADLGDTRAFDQIQFGKDYEIE